MVNVDHNNMELGHIVTDNYANRNMSNLAIDMYAWFHTNNNNNNNNNNNKILNL
jgi:hypothetical protein